MAVFLPLQYTYLLPDFAAGVRNIIPVHVTGSGLWAQLCQPLVYICQRSYPSTYCVPGPGRALGDKHIPSYLQGA